MQILDYDEEAHRLHVRFGRTERVHDGVPRWLFDRLRTVETPLAHYRRTIEDSPQRYPVVARGP